jgi:NADH-quinone oxidoreductase subunit M
MNLTTLLIIPFLGALASWAAEQIREGSARFIALVTALGMCYGAVGYWQEASLVTEGYFRWESFDWIPTYGITFSLGLDGLGFMMIALSALLSLVAVASSWTYIKKRAGGFYFCLFWVIGGTMGVFMAHDLFLFYFFWEMMLVPMYFLIGVWGHENRVYAAIKFFLFTFISGLALLAALLALYWIHGQVTGQFTFDYRLLLNTPLSLTQQSWILAGLLIGFAVKLPIFGLHTWLPDAHTEAPTAGSIILAGLLLKTGAYGIIRFAMPFCPEAFSAVAWWLGLIGIIGIFYGAILAFMQTDLKRLVAYSSVSHMGFVLLALAANNTIGGQGAIMQMVCHGLSTGALFAVVGMIDQRFHTRSLTQLGGLWSILPRLSGFLIFFAIASLGLPGLGNFIAELLSLIGTYEVWPSLAIAGAIGLFFAATYTLKFIGQSVYGTLKFQNAAVRDLSVREWLILIPLGLSLIGLGLKPGVLLKFSEAWWQNNPRVSMQTLSGEPAKGDVR